MAWVCPGEDPFGELGGAGQGHGPGSLRRATPCSPRMRAPCSIRGPPTGRRVGRPPRLRPFGDVPGGRGTWSCARSSRGWPTPPGVSSPFDAMGITRVTDARGPHRSMPSPEGGREAARRARLLGLERHLSGPPGRWPGRRPDRRRDRRARRDPRPRPRDRRGSGRGRSSPVAVCRGRDRPGEPLVRLAAHAHAFSPRDEVTLERHRRPPRRGARARAAVRGRAAAPQAPSRPRALVPTARTGPRRPRRLRPGLGDRAAGPPPRPDDSRPPGGRRARGPALRRQRRHRSPDSPRRIRSSTRSATSSTGTSRS